MFRLLPKSHARSIYKSSNRHFTQTNRKFNKNQNHNSSENFNSTNYASICAAIAGSAYFYTAIWRPNVAEEYETATGKHDSRNAFQLIFGSEDKNSGVKVEPVAVSLQQVAVEEEEDNSGDELKVFEEAEPEVEREPEPVQVVEEPEVKLEIEQVQVIAEPEPEVQLETEPEIQLETEPEIQPETPLTSIPENIESAKEIIDTIKETVETAKELIEESQEIVDEVKDVIQETEKLADSVSEVLTELKEDVEAVVEEITPVVNNVVEIIKEEAPKVEKIVEQVVETIIEETPKVVEELEKVAEVVVETIVEETPKVIETVEKVAEKVEEVVDTIVEKVEEVVEAPKVEEKTLFEQAVEEIKEDQKIEIDPNQLPEEVPYLLIGGGAASFAAMRAITTRDPGAKVLILTDEDYVPYQRPPLSKELWFGNTEESADSLTYMAWNKKARSIYMDAEFNFVEPGELNIYEGSKVAVARNCSVSHVDPVEDVVHLTDGRIVRFGKCLIATGGVPKRMEELEHFGDDKVTYYRKLNDFKKLEKQSRTDFENKTIAVIGGGFLGSEIAIALGTQSKKHNFNVTQVIKETGNLGAVLPDYLSEWSTARIRDCNVNVLTSERVQSAEKIMENEVERIQLNLQSGKSIVCDHIIAAVGLEIPRELADKSGIEFDDRRGGYVVNSQLQARSNIWAAGDATSFYDIKLGRRRVEHHDHAVVSGRLAGQNMTGAKSAFWHQSMFWSDLGPKIGFEAMGLVDSKRYRTVGFFGKATKEDTPENREAVKDSVTLTNSQNDDSKKYGKGVIFYVNKKNIIVGCVTWNIFGRTKTIRKIIADQVNMEDTEMQGLAKMFKIQ